MCLMATVLTAQFQSMIHTSQRGLSKTCRFHEVLNLQVVSDCQAGKWTFADTGMETKTFSSIE